MRFKLLDDDKLDIDGTTVYRIMYLKDKTLGGYMCLKSKLKNTITDEDTIIINSKIDGSFLYYSIINNSNLQDCILSDMSCNYSTLNGVVSNINCGFAVLQDESVYTENINLQ